MTGTEPYVGEILGRFDVGTARIPRLSRPSAPAARAG
jgi:hypothetical protein